MTPIWTRLNIQALLTQFVAWIPRLLSAIVILIVFWLVWRFLRPALGRLFTGAGINPALAKMLLSSCRFTVATFGLIMAINQVGIDVGAALAGLGVVGLTIGFAARDTLSNIMAGFLILWDKPFQAGDWVTLGDQYGKVEDITMRTTRLQTWSNTRVIIPNQTVINQVLVNHSSNDRLRIEVPISLSTQGDIQAIRSAIVAAVQDIDGVLNDPPPSVVIKSIGAGNTDLVIHAWVRTAEQEKPVQFKILEVARPLLQTDASR